MTTDTNAIDERGDPRQIIDSIPYDEFFTTADIIRRLRTSGEFLSDRMTPVSLSPNAGIGRILSRDRSLLDIVKRGCQKIRDDVGHRTTTAVWMRRR